MTISAVSAAQSRDAPVGILISREIRPYMEMVQGLEARLNSPSVRIFLDDAGNPFSHDPRFQALRPQDFALMIAVGPQAIEALVARHWSAPMLYGMVLNPDRFFHAGRRVCGVSLNLNSWDQIYWVHQVFPRIKRLGVLFNPTKNQAWFNAARTFMTLRQISLVPLKVAKRSDIVGLFKPPGPPVDAILFIPDQTVISPAIIAYVIKESIREGIATIGYNRFFNESGAVLSFVVDYRRVGDRVAEMAKNLMAGKPCSSSGPPFSVLLNEKVAKTLGMIVANPLPPGVQSQ